MAKLIIRSGPQVGTEYPMDRSVVRLGRGSGSDIVLPSSQLSRQHAEISQQGDQFFIRDLGSTNGTFVNGERISGSRPLRPGDQVQLGDITLAFDMGAAVPAGAATAAAGVATDWEAELWDDEYEQSGSGGGKKNVMIWVLGGVVAILLIAIGVGAFTIFGGEDTLTPEVGDATVAPTSAIVVVPTATQEDGPVVPPTETPLIDVDLPTVEVDVPTVEVEVPAAGGDAPPVEVPKEVGQALPTGMPVSPENLEQLPAMVTQFLGDVPPDQLPQVIGQQMQSMSPQELQAMIGSLFPGVDPAQLPQVIAASFPGLPQSEIQALLGQVFPGQTFQLPDAGGAVGGRIMLGIYEQARGSIDLYVVNAMGGQPTLLKEHAGEPALAPDGQWFVYFSYATDALGLRLRTFDGSEDRMLTSSDQDAYPSFSPDGQRITFYNFNFGSVEVINRDGSGRREITKGEFPDWSPTGDQIVYRGCLGGGTCGLLVANADGSNPRQITTHANDSAPRWSPNGGQIVFYSDRDGNWEIYVINSDGSWLRRITNHQASDYMPVWSPDGLRIAFRSDRGGQDAVYTTSGIGGGAIKLLDAGFPPDEVWDLAQMDWIK